METIDPFEEAWKDKEVFLTGGTGMLGAALLLKMVQDTNASRFHVLVRGGEDMYGRM